MYTCIYLFISIASLWQEIEFSKHACISKHVLFKVFRIVFTKLADLYSYVISFFREPQFHSVSWCVILDVNNKEIVLLLLTCTFDISVFTYEP